MIAGLQLHPAARPSGWRGRSDLQPADLTAVPAPDTQRQSALAVAGGNHRGSVQLRTSVAARAVGVEPVAVLEQAGEGAEVDHARASRRNGLQ